MPKRTHDTVTSWRERQQQRFVGLWGQFIVGSLMIGAVIFGAFLWVSSMIGVWAAFGAFGFAGFLTIWLIVGIILLAKGVSKWK